MNFSRKKLPREAAESLRRCPIDAVSPYALMIAPVYVYLKRNEKFVAVKAPLDFFSPDELERMKTYESFFFPEFVDRALPFKDAASSLKAVMSVPEKIKTTTSKRFPAVTLTPTPFEISDSAFKIMGPLWGKNKSIETFFVCVFANELCEPLPQNMCVSAREESVERFEVALSVSSWMVFFAAWIGYLDSAFLNRLRINTFEYVFSNVVDGSIPEQRMVSELDELLFEVLSQLKLSQYERIQASDLDLWECKVAEKIKSRISRATTQLLEKSEFEPSIFGEGGLIDV